MYNTKTVIENYMPRELHAYYERAFAEKSDKFKELVLGNAPFAFQDGEVITDCTLKKISIPVFKTGKADGEGKLTFTLLVHDGSLDGLKKEANRKYEIKIDPAKHGVVAEDESVRRYVEVDLTQYGIVLAKGETLAMFTSTDTIAPMQATADDGGVLNEAVKAMADSNPEGQGYFFKVGTSTMNFYGSPVIPVDLEWEKTYSAEAQRAAAEREREYRELVSLLKEKYKGKNLSVLGDSISTFKGIGDNVEYNSALYDNLMFYSYLSSPYKWENTYWGRLVTDLEMNLCVANGWGSGRVFGRPNAQNPPKSTFDKVINYRDSAPERAKQLSRNDGTSPDLILMYMGINDLHSNAVFGKTPFGGLYDQILEASPDTYESLVDACLGEALSKTDNGRRLLNEESKPTYASFEEAYALALYIIKEKYPDAEVVCIGLQNNARAAFTVEKQQRINLIIKALAEHFEYVYADQTGDYCEINTGNMHYYTMDIGCVHPDSYGHGAIERMIMRYLADKTKNG